MKKANKFVTNPTVIILVLVVLVAGLIALRQMTQPSPEPPVTDVPQGVLPDPVVPPFVGVPRSLRGQVLCLPHIDQEGPQTMECAYGIQDEEGVYYGLRDADPEMKNLSSLPMNETIEINGTFKEETNTIYPTVGIIEMQSFTTID